MTAFPNNLFSLLVANILEIIGPNGAFLLYSGTPAHGNLVASISANGGTDPFGNVYKSGLTSINSAGFSAELRAGQLFFDYLASPLLTQVGSVDIGVPASGNPSLQLASPTEDTTGNKAISEMVLFGANPSGSSQPFTVFYGANDIAPGSDTHIPNPLFTDSTLTHATVTFIAGDDNQINVTAESWHGAALNANFGSDGAAFAVPRYQFEPINGGRTRLSGSIQLSGNVAANTTMFTLPVGYRPSFEFDYNCPGNFVGGNAVAVLPNGNVNTIFAGNLGQILRIDNVFPLD